MIKRKPRKIRTKQVSMQIQNNMQHIIDMERNAFSATFEKNAQLVEKEEKKQEAFEKLCPSLPSLKSDKRQTKWFDFTDESKIESLEQIARANKTFSTQSLDFVIACVDLDQFALISNKDVRQYTAIKTLYYLAKHGWNIRKEGVDAIFSAMKPFQQGNIKAISLLVISHAIINGQRLTQEQQKTFLAEVNCLLVPHRYKKHLPILIVALRAKILITTDKLTSKEWEIIRLFLSPSLGEKSFAESKSIFHVESKIHYPDGDFLSLYERLSISTLDTIAQKLKEGSPLTKQTLSYLIDKWLSVSKSDDELTITYIVRMLIANEQLELPSNIDLKERLIESIRQSSNSQDIAILHNTLLIYLAFLENNNIDTINISRILSDYRIHALYALNEYYRIQGGGFIRENNEESQELNICLEHVRDLISHENTTKKIITYAKYSQEFIGGCLKKLPLDKSLCLDEELCIEILKNYKCVAKNKEPLSESIIEKLFSIIDSKKLSIIPKQHAFQLLEIIAKNSQVKNLEYPIIEDKFFDKIRGYLLSYEDLRVISALLGLICNYAARCYQLPLDKEFLKKLRSFLEKDKKSEMDNVRKIVYLLVYIIKNISNKTERNDVYIRRLLHKSSQFLSYLEAENLHENIFIALNQAIKKEMKFEKNIFKNILNYLNESKNNLNKSQALSILGRSFALSKPFNMKAIEISLINIILKADETSSLVLDASNALCKYITACASLLEKDAAIFLYKLIEENNVKSHISKIFRAMAERSKKWILSEKTLDIFSQNLLHKNSSIAFDSMIIIFEQSSIKSSKFTIPIINNMQSAFKKIKSEKSLSYFIESFLRLVEKRGEFADVIEEEVFLKIASIAINRRYQYAFRKNALSFLKELST